MTSQKAEGTELEQDSLLSPGFSPGEIVIGVLSDIDSQGRPLVEYAQNSLDQPLTAISTISVNQQQIGRQLALLFADGDPLKPVIMGLIHSPLNELIENFEIVSADDSKTDTEKVDHSESKNNGADAYVDGQRIVLEGKEEIVLKCGDASITLTKAGKILIRGKYLLNRSSGVNRIMGGSVQVN